MNNANGEPGTSEENNAKSGNASPDPLSEANVHVAECDMGKGVFAGQVFLADSIIGEITGDVIDDPMYGSNYAIDLENGHTLEPSAPFRFVNHSCEPNSEFTFFTVDVEESDKSGHSLRLVFLTAVQRIAEGEELTIDYNWPAESAIPCRCLAADCRGWIVAEEELVDVLKPEK
jgi:hypothetical protein